MTDDELQAIEARATAATEGPWKTLSGMVIGLRNSELVCSVGPEFYVTAKAVKEWEDFPGNQAFIAAARTDVPALVAEVRRLHAGLRALEPWHFVGMYDEQRCFFCDATRDSIESTHSAHAPDCIWATVMKP